MRTSSTFSVLFWVNPAKASNGAALIYIRVTVNQKRVLISTKRKISLLSWDSKKQKVRGNFSEAREINQYL